MMESKQQKQSDLWWLKLEEATNYKYVYVCHQEPYSDEPNSSKDPLSTNRYFSLNINGNLSGGKRRYPLEFICQWREKCANTNVFRSLALFSAGHNGEKLLGPFVIDIDRDNYETNRGYVQDLNKALEDARKLVKEYLCKFNEDDFRIFFTGHKGFNIEVRPQALGIDSLDNRWQQFKDKRAEINETFGCSFVDTIKEYVRLHNSVNRFIANDGTEVNRMKFELSLCELNSLGIEEIRRRSEKLVSDYLSKK